MYINTTTLQQASESELRAQFPNTSFSIPFVPPEGWMYVFPYPKPQEPNSYVIPGTPELTVLGHWEERWNVVPFSQEEIDARAEQSRLSAIPYAVSPRQIRQGLTAVGLRASVEAAIAVANQDTKDWYEFATTFERNNPLVLTLATALNVTERQLDDLWTYSGSL
jgi:hypothetical protein